MINLDTVSQCEEAVFMIGSCCYVRIVVLRNKYLELRYGTTVWRSCIAIKEQVRPWRGVKIIKYLRFRTIIKRSKYAIDLTGINARWRSRYRNIKTTVVGRAYKV